MCLLCTCLELFLKLLVDMYVILLIFKWFKMSYICCAPIWVKIIYILLCVLCMLEHLVLLCLPIPILLLLLLLSPSLHVFAPIYGHPSRLPGGPPHTHVPSFQRQQQHHFLQRKVCLGPVLQSTW